MGNHDNCKGKCSGQTNSYFINIDVMKVVKIIPIFISFDEVVVIKSDTHFIMSLFQWIESVPILHKIIKINKQNLWANYI